MSENSNSGGITSERYFPSYSIQRDIGIAEYNSADAHLRAENQAVKWATSITVLLSGVAGFSVFEPTALNDTFFLLKPTSDIGHLYLLIVVLLISFALIIHLADLAKSRSFAERKVIVLRRMLGVSYGENSLVLPNWRIEGADNPFAVKIFRGYLDHRIFPLYVILAFGSLTVFGLSIGSINYVLDVLDHEGRAAFGSVVILALFYFTTGLAVYVRQLRDFNENSVLMLAKMAARVLFVPVSNNFPYKNYRILLDVAEAERLKANFKLIVPFAILIEDNEFYKHKGINWRGIARAIKGKLSSKNLGGGSSITQQFARSNYINKLNLGIRRKIVEFILAKWIETVMTKNEILKGYLSTARFEFGVYGFHRAYRHFGLDQVSEMQSWEAFILIERLGNIHGRFLGNRVKALLEKSIAKNLLTMEDARTAIGYYRNMMDTHFELRDGDINPQQVIDQLVEKFGDKEF